MAGASDNVTWHQRLVAELRADRKKAVVLAGLAGVLLLLGVRMVVQRLGGPDEAQAAPPVAKATSAAAQDGAGGRAGASEATHRPRPLPVEPQPITRDLFQANEMYFPKVDPRLTKTQVEEPPDAPPQDPQRLLREAIRAQARTLLLQATISGRRPAAIINDTMVTRGETVAGFRVTKIAAESVTVEKDGVTLVLYMERAE